MDVDAAREKSDGKIRIWQCAKRNMRPRGGDGGVACSQ